MNYNNNENVKKDNKKKDISELLEKTKKYDTGTLTSSFNKKKNNMEEKDK
jgi:hypothetical protein